MQTNSDFDPTKAARTADAEAKINKLNQNQKILLAAECGYRLAHLAFPGETERSLQGDISNTAQRLTKAAAMMHLVEIVANICKRHTEMGTRDRAEILSEIMEAMMATTDACEDQIKADMSILKNLAQEFKERYPETSETMEQQAIKKWMAQQQAQ